MTLYWRRKNVPPVCPKCGAKEPVIINSLESYVRCRFAGWHITKVRKWWQPFYRWQVNCRDCQLMKTLFAPSFMEKIGTLND